MVTINKQQIQWITESTESLAVSMDESPLWMIFPNH